MKRHLPLAALVVLVFAAFCVAQDATPSPSPAAKPKPRMSKAALMKKLSANENALWNAWKNKDAKPFNMWLAVDSVMVGEQGEVKSFSLSDWKLTMVNADAAFLTYKGSADGTCGGQAIPTVWASSLWVNRKGKWQAFSHQETPVKP
ncbi:MAG: hypothetical protein DMF73_07905 [Acidobacteria bacterium]|nr:MAG: hypothetical protein DMF73_07905 [Acidobacteriota bacterium]